MDQHRRPACLSGLSAAGRLRFAIRVECRGRRSDPAGVAAFRKESRGELILIGFLLLLSVIGAAIVNHSLAQVCHRRIDLTLLLLDHGVSTAIFHWMLAHAIMRSAIVGVYYGLPVFGSLVIAAGPHRLSLARCWIVAAVLAPPLYLAFPAAGPAHVSDIDAPINCMPSLHMTWALICAVYAGPSLRIIAIAFALLTAVATLGTGEHYWLDLIVALPYTFAICRLQCWLWRERISASAGDMERQAVV